MTDGFACDDALTRFRAFAGDVEGSLPEDGFARLISFYKEVPALQAADHADADMLLYQWGTYRWYPEDPFFEISLTRQVIYPDGEDQEIFQLALVYRFTPEPALDALGRGSEWCPSQDAVPNLRAFLDRSDALSLAMARTPAKVDLTWSRQ
ncbi:MAG: hypothetical protein KJO78_14895 [Alphaproteobacteria bacterium]|nr:hypothetical protein [Alphaproteobacteria bacterium]